MSLSVTVAQAWDAGLLSGSTFTASLDLAGADLLVVAVSWQLDGDFPLITYGDHVVRPIGNARLFDADLGSLALFALAAPPAGANALAVHAPWWMGNGMVSATGIAGGSGDLGVAWSAVQKGGASPDMDARPADAASLRLLAGMARYSAPEITPPEGWTEQASVSGSGQRAYVLTAGATADAVSVMAASWSQILWAGIEIFSAGRRVPAAHVDTTLAQVLDFGLIGLNTVKRRVSMAGASLLVLAVIRGNVTGAPTVTVDGRPVTFVDQLSYEADGGVISLTAVNAPPDGEVEIAITGYYGYYGPTMAAVIGLSGTTGQAGGLEVTGLQNYRLALNLTGATDPRNVLVAISALFWRRFDPPVASYGWQLLAAESGDNAALAIFRAPTRYGGLVEFLGPVSPLPVQKAVAIEIVAAPAEVAAVSGTLLAPLASPQPTAAGRDAGQPVPSGQLYDVYYETWMDHPWPHVPDQLYLTHVPRYVHTLVLSFAFPLCTYASLDDNIAQTVGLGWLGTGHQLKAALDLLRRRHPTIQFMLSVQQSTPAQYRPEPYDPTGWAGVRGEHLAAMRLFCEDMGITGISVDYELFSESLEVDHHCWTDASGERRCYTDAELVWVLKIFRAAFPRPTYRIFLTPPHVAAYFGPYEGEFPGGWNAGYVACLKRDPDARATLDGMHVMTYDAGADYDPVRAMEAFAYHFPTVPLYVGLRAGPREWGSGGDRTGAKRSLSDIMEYCNAAIRTGAAGAFMYAMMWDLFDPSGDYGRDYPDGSMVSQLVAERFHLPEASRPLASDGSASAGFVTAPRLGPGGGSM
ncbi:hypothetical protein [Azorhizobium caulinodans]|uniref:hypothetical protein n=1 Tax=Azorhizobium caulinodans TaxID=7 RepID=UPI002FBE8148